MKKAFYIIDADQTYTFGMDIKIGVFDTREEFAGYRMNRNGIFANFYGRDIVPEMSTYYYDVVSKKAYTMGSSSNEWLEAPEALDYVKYMVKELINSRIEDIKELELIREGLL